MIAVIVSFDRFPLSLLGCYGSVHQLTPHLDRLAANSVVFDQHFGDDFSESPTQHAWWTGTQHCLEGAGESQITRPNLPTWLKQAGVETHWITNRGEDTTVPLPKDSLTQVYDSLSEMIEGGCELLSNWSLDGETQRCLWVKVNGPDWSHDQEETETLESGELPSEIQAKLREIDTGVGQIRSVLENVTGNLFLGITASRGAPLNFRAETINLRPGWAEESVHTPLIIHCSDQLRSFRFHGLTQSTDLPATLLDFFAIPAGEPSTGRSLLPVLGDPVLPGREHLTLGCPGEWEAIRTEKLYLVREKASESLGKLFLKPDDVWDWHDIASQEQETVEVLSHKLDTEISRTAMSTTSAGNFDDVV